MKVLRIHAVLKALPEIYQIRRPSSRDFKVLRLFFRWRPQLNTQNTEKKRSLVKCQRAIIQTKVGNFNSLKPFSQLGRTVVWLIFTFNSCQKLTACTTEQNFWYEAKQPSNKTLFFNFNLPLLLEFQRSKHLSCWKTEAVLLCLNQR